MTQIMCQQKGILKCQWIDKKGSFEISLIMLGQLFLTNQPSALEFWEWLVIGCDVCTAFIPFAAVKFHW